MKKTLMLALVVVCLAAAAPAQDTPAAEFFGGYSYLRFNAGSGADGLNTHGWNSSIAFNMSPNFALVGDVAGYYKSELGVSANNHTFLFGPKFSARGDKATPFAHALFGGARFSADAGGLSASENAFAMALGGGVDVKVNPAFSIRVAQFDYLMTRYGSETQNNARFSVGVVFHIGNK
jgi:opacity protein-like surface antigen